jgi:hypothetical protein
MPNLVSLTARASNGQRWPDAATVVDTLTRRTCNMTARPDHPHSAPTGIDILDMTTGMAGALATMFPYDKGLARTESPP